jgi:hypothetical protein
MLQAIECAVEFWLALEWSPQAQWLLEASETGPLQDEVKRQSAEVWQFILDREIEAPARFQAIQTQRAAAAILRQQARPNGAGGAPAQALRHRGPVCVWRRHASMRRARRLPGAR